MEKKSTFLLIAFLLVLAVLTGVSLKRTLLKDSLLMKPYAVNPKGSSLVKDGAKASLTLKSVLEDEKDSFAKLVKIGDIGISVMFADLSVEGEPVELSEIKFTQKPVTSRELHPNSVRQIVVRREDFPDDYAIGTTKDCTASECKFPVNVRNLFSGDKALTSGAPIRLKLEVNIAPEGEASLGDAFQFEIADASDITAETSTKWPVSIYNSGATLSSVHIVPNRVSVRPSWPSETVPSVITSANIIGVIEVLNEGDYPIYLSSAVLDIESTAKGKVFYSLRASASGSNPNDISVPYANGRRTGYFSSLSPSNKNDLGIPPKSWRYITVIAEGNIKTGDSFSVSIKDIGSLRYKVLESDLKYSGNAYSDQDQKDTIKNLLVGGTLELGSVIMQ